MGITLLRCDDRLIHGQCIVKVLNDCKIAHIILVDAFTASNPVLCNIYKMAVPSTVKIDVLGVKEAISKIEESAGKAENTLVLVKDPVVALELQMGTELLPKKLNIGPMSNRNDTVKITFFSFLKKAEREACDVMTDRGIRVYFQQVPGEKELEWKKCEENG